MKTAPLGTVPRLWPNSTIVCLGAGPSLNQDDVNYCRDKAHLIAVNNAVLLAPFAEVLYACDAKYWRWHEGFPSFAGLKFGLQGTRIPGHEAYQGLVLLKNSGRHGLSRDPSSVRTGHSSGYQAINVAVHLGASRIILLGYDYTDAGGAHFPGGDHPDRSRPPFLACLKDYATLPAALAEAGVSIVNCTPNSRLQCFTMAPLREVIEAVAA